MSRTILGSLVGALAVTALAAPAASQAAAPADVTVRVEGPSGQLAYDRLRTTRTPVVKDGDEAHACSGTSAAGALEQATGGSWSASWFDGLGYAVDAVDGVRGSSMSEYWTVWLNGRSSASGLCDAELEDGDDLLVYLCRSGADFSCENRPLALLASRRTGATQAVRVVELADDGSASPAAGATVRGGARPVRADARGRAKVRLAGAQSTLVARRAGDVPSAPLFCSADACGSSDRAGPAVRLTGLRRSYPARRAPRKLRGVAADPAGAIVELRLVRRHRGACTTFDGRRERFVRCAKKPLWFAAGDRRRWSYLLPARLKPGRYALVALATDPSGNRGRATARFRVRAGR